MDLTKQQFIRWVLLSVTVILAAMMAGILLEHFGYLQVRSETLYTPTQIIGADGKECDAFSLGFQP